MGAVFQCYHEFWVHPATAAAAAGGAARAGAAPSPQPAANLFDRLMSETASRDIAYYVFGVALIGRLDWLLWVYAFGCHAFWIAMVAALVVERRRATRAAPGAVPRSARAA